MKIVRADDDPQLLVADASVLINFLAIDRIDLLAALPYQLIVTEHVEVEIDEGYPEQLARFRSANTDGVFQIVRVDHPKELRLFSKLQADGRLGLGECSALACAHCRGGAIAIDDKVAIKRANDMFVEMSILRTLDLMVLSTPKWKRVRLDQFISPRRTRRRCRESPAQLHELVYEEPYSECSGFNLAARSQPTKGCRCVDSRKQGNGKKKGEGNRKNGNRYLAWAYIEAANFAVGHNAKAKRFYARKKAKTNNIVVHKALAHKLARAG